MKIRVLSDLHLEFNKNNYIDIPEGDVLILAGDICLPCDYEDYHEFFLQCVAKYNKVFYIMGNHEQYGTKWGEAEKILRDKLPKEITFLQNQSEYYNGVHFVGATMWTNFDDDANKAAEAGQYMNDYYQCEGFTPSVALRENINTIEWFNQCVPMLKMAPIVMITHHAPSYQSVKGRYLQSAEAYANRLEGFIEKNPTIALWCHGHIHHNNNYKIGDCTILSNPRGYEEYEMNEEFQLTAELSVI